MAFSAEQIKNLALMELNHETISDWTDSSNTDIPIIDTQYALAKPVALTMYQWSWAFKYMKLNLYKNYFDIPSDWISGSAISVFLIPVATISQTAGDSLENISVNAETFTTQINQDGVYVFTFDGADWQYDGNTVNLADYGISFTGTPVATDALTVNYTAPKQITDFSHNTTSTKIYANQDKIYLDYTATGDVQTQVILSGVANEETIGKYKNAAFLPEDFAGYLACYTNKCLSLLADYITVGDTLYTNADELHIKYIGNVDESVFPPEFVDWFKIFLAQRINGYLNGDMQRQQLLTSEEPFFFRKAKNIDSKRNKHDSLSGNPILWVRGKLGGGM